MQSLHSRKIAASTPSKQNIQGAPYDHITAEQANYTYDYARPSPSYIVNATDVWEDASTSQHLPNWMKDYFRWHKETRQQLMLLKQQQQQHRTTIEWKRYRYLLVTCLPNFPKCGGLADRLSSLPFLIQVAAQTKRLLLFKWGRPAELEDFLLPPVGGVDWRVPPWLLEHLVHAGAKATVQDRIVELAQQTDLSVLRIKFQSHDHGSVYYNEHRLQKEHEPLFQTVFRDCWNSLFTPVPAIAMRIEQHLQQHQLIPNQYMAAHLRALYNVKKRDLSLVDHLTHNAINCTSQLLSEQAVETGKVFFAADLVYATEEAVDYGMQKGLQVHVVIHAKDPLHLDKTKDWKQRQPSDFYDTVVDLYLMALSHCVTFGMGGYGKLASYLSFNASCAIQHHSAISIRRCEFHHPKSVIVRPKEGSTNDGSKRRSLFPRPMLPIRPESKVSTKPQNIYAL